MSRSVYMKPKGMLGRCMACGRSTKLHVHQGCGAILAARRTGFDKGGRTVPAKARRERLSKTQL